MARNNSDDDDYVSYTLIVSPGIDDTSRIKMRKFYGGTAKEWIQWSIAFKSLIKKKKWPPDQAIRQLLVLIEGQFAAAVERLYEQALASNAPVPVDQFLDEIGGWFVPLDFRDSLEAEMFHLTKRRDESVQQLLHRMQELVRIFANLPSNAEEVVESQQCRFFKRAMPYEWQHNLRISGLPGDKLRELVLYFQCLEDEESRSRRTKGNKQTNKPNEKKFHPRGGDRQQTTPDTKMNNGKNEDKNKWCTHHKTHSHNTEECYALKKKKRTEDHKQLDVQESKDQGYPRISCSSESDVAVCLEVFAVPLKERLDIDLQLRTRRHAVEHALIDAVGTPHLFRERCWRDVGHQDPIQLEQMDGTSSPRVRDERRAARVVAAGATDGAQDSGRVPSVLPWDLGAATDARAAERLSRAAVRQDPSSAAAHAGLLWLGLSS
ncbi:hypothetical protein PINS_up020661 [Pythium insidiosum]|nr:hypothetical protein PINS_up020661 [Pythium insidiosum]